MRRSHRGMSLLEIMIALIILALSFIPIIGVIGSGSADTDVTKSYVFAQTSVRNILIATLDNLPFAAIDTNGSSNVADSDGRSEPDVGRLQTVGAFTAATSPSARSTE